MSDGLQERAARVRLKAYKIGGYSLAKTVDEAMTEDDDGE